MSKRLKKFGVSTAAIVGVSAVALMGLAGTASAADADDYAITATAPTMNPAYVSPDHTESPMNMIGNGFFSVTPQLPSDATAELSLYGPVSVPYSAPDCSDVTATQYQAALLDTQPSLNMNDWPESTGPGCYAMGARITFGDGSVKEYEPDVNSSIRVSDPSMTITTDADHYAPSGPITISFDVQHMGSVAGSMSYKIYGPLDPIDGTCTAITDSQWASADTPLLSSGSKSTDGDQYDLDNPWGTADGVYAVDTSDPDPATVNPISYPLAEGCYAVSGQLSTSSLFTYDISTWQSFLVQDEQPPADTPATPAEVTFAEQCGTDNDTYTIPETEGIEYLVGGDVVKAGTYPGTGDVTVTAQAIDGYVIEDGATTEWSHSFDDTACETPREPLTITKVDAADHSTTVPGATFEWCFPRNSAVGTDGAVENPDGSVTLDGITYDPCSLPDGTVTHRAGQHANSDDDSIADIADEMLTGGTLTTGADGVTPAVQLPDFLYYSASDSIPGKSVYIFETTVPDGYLPPANIGQMRDGAMENGCNNWDAPLVPQLRSSGAALAATNVSSADHPTTCMFEDAQAPVKETPATPAEVTFAEQCGVDDDSYTIPETDGVEYLVDGDVVKAGTYPGTGDVTVTAQAIDGYEIADGATTEWSHSFDDTACETPAEPVTPAEVTFAEFCGTDGDTYTIPDTEGVEYLVDGDVVEAGTYPGTGDVTVKAQAIDGYELAADATTEWSFSFDDSACETETPEPTDPESPEPTEPSTPDTPTSTETPEPTQPSHSQTPKSHDVAVPTAVDAGGGNGSSGAGLLAGGFALLALLGGGVVAVTRRRGHRHVG